MTTLKMTSTQKWNEFQYIVTEKTFRAFCQKFTDIGRTSSQVVYLAFIACKEETKTATEVFSWWGCDQQSAWCQITLIVILKFISIGQCNGIFLQFLWPHNWRSSVGPVILCIDIYYDGSGHCLLQICACSWPRPEPICFFTFWSNFRAEKMKALPGFITKKTSVNVNTIKTAVCIGFNLVMATFTMSASNCIRQCARLMCSLCWQFTQVLGLPILFLK